MPDEPLTSEELEDLVPEDPVDWDLEERDAYMDAHEDEEAPVEVLVKENE